MKNEDPEPKLPEHNELHSDQSAHAKPWMTPVTFVRNLARSSYTLTFDYSYSLWDWRS